MVFQSAQNRRGTFEQKHNKSGGVILPNFKAVKTAW